jgi:hypothetical protein
VDAKKAAFVRDKVGKESGGARRDRVFRLGDPVRVAASRVDLGLA